MTSPKSRAIANRSSLKPIEKVAQLNFLPCSFNSLSFLTDQEPPPFGQQSVVVNYLLSIDPDVPEEAARPMRARTFRFRLGGVELGTHFRLASHSVSPNDRGLLRGVDDVPLRRDDVVRFHPADGARPDVGGLGGGVRGRCGLARLPPVRDAGPAEGVGAGGEETER